MGDVTTIALLGFGEVGQALADDLRRQSGIELHVWDIAFVDPQSAPSCAARARRPFIVGGDMIGMPHVAAGGVLQAASAAEAIRDADLVISAVTAAQTVVAARTVLPALRPGAYFLDLNSSSPGMKQEAALMMAWAEARYVEAAVMSPIHPRGIGSPMLLGGPHVRDFLTVAEGLGFTGATPFSEVVGRAAATKLCRSVMIKGVEALLTESLLAARHYGVEQVVLDSLSDLLPLPDWTRTAQYMISRSLEHGTRRAEEMREAARTVEEAGVPAPMSHAIAERQDWAAEHRAALSPDLLTMLDAVIARLDTQ